RLPPFAPCRAAFVVCCCSVENLRLPVWVAGVSSWRPRSSGHRTGVSKTRPQPPDRLQKRFSTEQSAVCAVCRAGVNICVRLPHLRLKPSPVFVPGSPGTRVAWSGRHGPPHRHVGLELQPLARGGLPPRGV